MYAPAAGKFRIGEGVPLSLSRTRSRAGPRRTPFAYTLHLRGTAMSELDTSLEELRAHAGVEHVLLVGRDGLLIHQSGAEEIDGETVAALTPGLVWACTSLGESAVQGPFRTAVLEWRDGIGIVADLSEDVLLVILLHPEVGFAPLLHAIRTRRAHLAELVG